MLIKEFYERLAILRLDMENKFSYYLKVENEMVFEGKFSQHGFIDNMIKKRFEKAKSEWGIASNKYNEFLNWGLQHFIRTP